MNSRTNRTDVARTLVTVALLVALAGCAGTHAVPTGPAPTTAAGATPTEPSPSPTRISAPVATDAPANTAVPADQVEAVRAAGRTVYVPVTGSGEGVLVDATPGAAPSQALIDDAEALAVEMTSAFDVMALIPLLDTPMEEAGLSAFFLRPAAMEGGSDTPAVGFKVSPKNVPGAIEFYETADQRLGYASRDEALAEVAVLIAANPAVAVIDLTD